MTREHKDQWVAALRSGKFQQVRSILATTEGFCCIGVYFHAVKGLTPNVENTTQACFPQLPQNLHANNGVTWINGMVADGVSAVSARHLASMNDTGSSFAEIADWIEEHVEVTQ